MPFYELTSTNSSKVLPHLDNNTSIILHHMDGCIHCEMFRPIWNEIGAHYKNKKSYVLVSVEYSSMNLLPKTMQNVQGFPTLRACKNKKPIAEFNDARTYDSVVEFVEKHGNNKPKTKENVKTPANKKTVSKK